MGKATEVRPVVAATSLKRALSLWHVVLYGLGVTIGAGIYVLVGVAAGRAGINAPFAFVIAALVMVPSALSFAELTVRMPVSAGEAAFVREGFGIPALALITGLLVVAVGVISAAAIGVGAAGYVRELIPLPLAVLVPAVIVAMGAIACWGIVESVTAAAVMTLIEVGGLLLIVVAGLLFQDGSVLARLPETVPLTLDGAVWSGIIGSGLIAFFAFIGFEGIVNIAEEVKEPQRTLPRAIVLTLVIATMLYVLVAAVAVLTVPRDELAGSVAPLSLVFNRVTGASPLILAAIAIVATLNGVVIQMIMASRVIYGMASQGSLPAWLAAVHPVLRTPLTATLLVIGIVLALAVLFPLEGLAELTSQVTLVVFALVNAALVLLKRRQPAPRGAFSVPMWMPVIGTLICVGFLSAAVLV